MRPFSRRHWRAATLVAIVLCGLVSTTGCDPIAGTTAADRPAADQNVLAELVGLSVAPWGSMARYSRERFPHWIEQGHGCDTRDVVLQRDGRDVRTGSGCAITAGSWFSPYDARTTNDPQELDIDHMVPLADAWRTGAAAWTDAKREQFANDLDRPQLLAVTASTNRSKGDQDPSQWRPPRHEFWCTYAGNWVQVKSYWQLTVTPAEKQALEDMLGTC